MIFSLFILAVIVITLIARYNEDDRLFWQLLISFCTAFALTTTIMQLKNNEQHKTNSTTQVYPTQESSNQMDSLYCPQFGLIPTTVSHVTDAVPVSQDSTFESSFVPYVCSKVTTKERDQPVGLYNVHKPRDISLSHYPWDTS